MGCCSRNDLTSSIFPPMSMDGEAVATELVADAFGKFRRWRHVVCQRVLETKLAPLIDAHLVESQDLNSLDRPQSGAEIRDGCHIVVVIRQSRHKHKAYPHQSLQRRKPEG